MKPLDPPPVRRLFVPDPGYVLFECDLARADAQIVARESNDLPLLDIFSRNTDIYRENAAWLYEIPIEKVSASQRQWNKNGVHAIDYFCKARTLGRTLHVTEHRAQEFMDDWWFAKHPGIRQWHRHIAEQLRCSRTVHNVYGFRRYYTDRLDNTLPQALAWIASSTVSVTINKIMLNLYNTLPEVQILLQIHDSVLGQVRVTDAERLLPAILKASHVEIPYDPPLVIPVTMKVSAASWGDIKPWAETKIAA